METLFNEIKEFIEKKKIIVEDFTFEDNIINIIKNQSGYVDGPSIFLKIQEHCDNKSENDPTENDPTENEQQYIINYCLNGKSIDSQIIDRYTVDYFWHYLFANNRTEKTYYNNILEIHELKKEKKRIDKKIELIKRKNLEIMKSTNTNLLK